jgi:hypothetical protein
MLYVAMSIPNWLAKGKQQVAKIPTEALVLAILLLSSLSSFGLGILYAKDTGIAGAATPGIVDASGPSYLKASAQEASVAAAATPAEAEQNAPAIPEGGQFVASKSGQRYYFPWCSGAKQIKEGNKIWFDSREAAEAKGYTPAKTCKGL